MILLRAVSAPIVAPSVISEVMTNPTLDGENSANIETTLSICSNEYSEALTALNSDPWDISSWMILVEEVEHGRGGAAKIDETYQKFLEKFPLSARFWMKLTSYYIKSLESHQNPQQHQQLITDTFEKCVHKCRSVPLWRSYLSFIKKVSVDRVIAAAKANANGQPTQQQIDQYFEERKRNEQAYEISFENVGMAVDAADLWRFNDTLIKFSFSSLF